MGTWRWRFLSTGAVPAALHAVQDLLLQFLPLLLLLGQPLGGRRARALPAVEDFAVLCVPQLGVQAAGGVEEGLVCAALRHFALRGTRKQGGLKN